MAGNRLDALVQKHLFPWDESKCRVCGQPIGVEVRTLYNRRQVCTANLCGAPQGDWKRADELPPPRYSSDAYASEALLEKMRKLGWQWVGESYPERERETGGIYFWQFYHSHSADARHPSARSNNRLEGIVLAALRASGVPEEEIQEALRG